MFRKREDEWQNLSFTPAKRRSRRRGRRKREKFFSVGGLIGICLVIVLILAGVTSFFLVHPKGKSNSVSNSEISEMEQKKETKKLKPVLMQAKLKQIELLLATHTITYETGNENRDTNLRVACEIINGCLIPPGDIWSWLEEVGPTTAEKGFKLAKVIINQQLVDELGGGVCQVCSTLFSALCDAGIIKEGHYFAKEHSLTSNYIKEGVDHEATVAVDKEPVTDFYFENTLECWIKIGAKAVGGQVAVQIFGLVYVYDGIRGIEL